MVIIESLNKIYKSKKRKAFQALYDINLTLEDTGLVFVLGKSGSGKSTLLNLIGSLDTITSGKITVGGNDISSFTANQGADYRNSHIGFIFQDYHLIDELTVFENIKLALNLNNHTDLSAISNALERVGLSGYEDRYPTELSGGEQQRVSIARAIAKNPKVILADEPTGNLDSATAQSIINLLKELSKERLILIVSHNASDAYTYADRIIELKGGRIISDFTKNPDFADEVTAKNGVIMYPDGTKLSDKDIETINKNAGNGLKIIRRTDKFLPTEQSTAPDAHKPILKSKLSLKSTAWLSGRFLKNKAFAIIASAFTVAVIMIIMALAQTIMGFNGNAVIAAEMAKSQEKSLLLSKTVDSKTSMQLERECRVAIGDSDVSAFYDAGYKGTIYPVLNVTLPITDYANTLGIKSASFGSNVYIKESLGTMVVTEEFFTKKFGKVEYLASATEPSPYGLIITDYLADAILASNSNYYGKKYSDIVGDYKPRGFTYSTVKVNSIICTGYKEQYKELFEKIANGEFSQLLDYYNDKDFLSLCDHIYGSLGFSFSLNPNFYDVAHLTRKFCSLQNVVLNGRLEGLDQNRYYVSFLPKDSYTGFRDNSIIMSYSKYNDFFGTSYNGSNLNTFVPHKVTLSSYRYSDVEKSNPLYTLEFTVERLSSPAETIIFAEGEFPELEQTIRKADIYYNSLYFDGVDGITSALDISKSLKYEYQGFVIEGISTMVRAIEVFTPIFELIAIILCVSVILVLVSFSTKMIKDKLHEIGILKAIGARNKSIGIVFGLQVALIAVLTCVLATSGYFFFIDMANDVLIGSLKQLAPTRIVLDLDFLIFSPNIALINCALTAILAIVSLVVPLLKIRSVEPVKIIKSKD